MGEIVLAAKITHVPTLIMSEQPGRLFGKRQQAIDGHREIARRAGLWQDGWHIRDQGRCYDMSKAYSSFSQIKYHWFF